MPSLALKQDLSGYRPNDAGVLAHALIALIAPVLPGLTDVALAERLHDLAGAVVSGENINRRRVLAATGSGHAAAYLRRYAPVEPWTLLGCEFDTGGGRVDLAWQHEDGRVLFDEIKTSNRPQKTVPPEWRSQIARYATAGAQRYGDRFAGVRLVPLGSLHLICLHQADGPLRPLRPTRAEPLAAAGTV